MTGQLSSLSIAKLRRLLLKGEICAADIVRSVEEAVVAKDAGVGAVLARDFPAALQEAERADLTQPLGGIPVGIKDVISVAGQPLTCGSRILQGGYVAPYDATVTSRLRKAGAIPFGRLNMDEFAMGSSTENSALQRTCNPWDLTRVPGGSSGGSAAAVAAGEMVATLGTDTGGSIRQPAAFCGITGLKPSYGRVSRYGLVAYASSLDQIGPMTRTVGDAALILNAIAGPDKLDSTCADDPVPDFAEFLSRDVKGLRIGLPREYFIDGIDPDVRSAVDNAASQLEAAGAELHEVSLPHTRYAVATYYVIATAEASSNLARFDGVRYGRRCDHPQDLADLYERTRAEGFGPEVKRRIILGTWVLSAGYHNAYYLRAQKVRSLIQRDFQEAFRKVDVLLSPTTPSPAFRIGERTTDPLEMYLADIFTIAANLAGICGISVPCGLTPAVDGRPPLPIGLQFMGPSMGEGAILQAASAWERLAGPMPRPPVV